MIKLTVLDKINMMELLPEKTNLMDGLVCKEIKKKITVEKEELDAIDFKNQDNGFMYNPEKNKESVKEIDFTESEMRILKNQVKKLDESNSIAPNILDLCIKINDS